MSASRTRIMATCCRWQRRERTSRGKTLTWAGGIGNLYSTPGFEMTDASHTTVDVDRSRLAPWKILRRGPRARVRMVVRRFQGDWRAVFTKRPNHADYVRGQFLTVRPWTFPARQHFNPGASPGTIEAASVPNRATGSSEARPD